METKTITLVQESFKKVSPNALAVSQLFYNKLFQLDPPLKALFPTNEVDMQQQSSKLMSMLGVAVTSLKDLDTLKPALEDLAKRHLEYKVEAFHYHIIGEALIATLKEGLKEDFTTEVQNAWEQTFTTVSNFMINAAYKN